MDLLKALLGNVSVNMFQHATMGAMFSMDECYSSLLSSTTIMATEEVFSMRSAPHNSRRAVLSAWSMLCLYNWSLFVALMSTQSRIIKLEMGLENQVKFWRVSTPRWLKKKWQEDFIVIWSDSSCVEICYQAVTSGEWESQCMCNVELESV
jgi:hypothetical protein